MSTNATVYEVWVGDTRPNLYMYYVFRVCVGGVGGITTLLCSKDLIYALSNTVGL